MNTSPMPDPGGPTLTPFEEAVVQTDDRIPSEASATGYEDAPAPSFAPRHSRRRALQEAKGGAQRFRTQNGQASQAGRSPLLTHPIVLRDLPAPGVRRRHSMCLVSARGARVLADWPRWSTRRPGEHAKT